jgi:hypothetical protein
MVEETEIEEEGPVDRVVSNAKRLKLLRKILKKRRQLNEEPDIVDEDAQDFLPDTDLPNVELDIL